MMFSKRQKKIMTVVIFLASLAMLVSTILPALLYI